MTDKELNRFRYPSHIYRKFEIVEDVKYGAKVYGVVEIKRLLGFTYRKRLKIRTLANRLDKYSGDKWVLEKWRAEAAIRGADRTSEWLFENKVLNS